MVYFDMRLNITLPLLTEKPLAFIDIEILCVMV